MDPRFDRARKAALADLVAERDTQEATSPMGVVKRAHVEAFKGGQQLVSQAGDAAGNAWDTITGWPDAIANSQTIQNISKWGDQGPVDHSQDLLHELENGGPSPMANSEEEQMQADVSKELGDSTLARSTAGIIGGVAEAGFNTFDAIKDDYTYTGPKSDFRKAVEAIDEDNREKDAVANITGSIAQFTAGLIGVGKVLGPVKALSSGKLAATAFEIARGGLAGALAMDPFEERLSDTIQQFPALENPVSAVLANDPDDSESLGRFKNALEGMGMDLAVAGAFGTVLKGIRYFRGGDIKQAEQVIAELASDEASVKAVLSAEKPRIRVKAGSERVPMETPQGTPQAAADATQEAVQPSVVDEAGDQLGDGVTEVKRPRRKEIKAPDFKSIVDGTTVDVDAIYKAGGYQAAKDAGYTFNTGASTPWQLLNTSDDVKVFLQNTAEVLKKDWDKVKGGDILSDAKLNRQIKNMVDWFNEDPASVVSEIVRSGKESIPMVRNMQAGYLISNKMFMDAYQVVDDMRWGKYAKYGDDIHQAQAESIRRLEVASQVYSSTQSIRSNTGRALRRMRGEFAIKPEDIARMKSLTPEQYMDFLTTTGGDPRKLKDLAKPGFIKRFWDEAMFVQRNGLLWGYPTHLVNMTGNGLMLFLRPVEKILGGIMQAAVGQGSPVVEQSAKEMYYTLASTWDGMKDGAAVFLKGDSKLAPHTSGWLDTEKVDTAQLGSLMEFGLRKFDTPADLYHNMMASFAYLYRNVSGVPTRTLAAQDEFFKTMRYRGVVQARASVEARRLGKTGQAFKDHISTRLKEAFDEAGRGIDPEALLEAQTTTFNQELLQGTVGASVRNFRANHTWTGGILPFVKTPINVLRYAHKYTPALNLFQKEYRQMISGAMGTEAQAQALGQMALGSMFATSAYSLAASGRITGGGPGDFKQQAELRATGWKPYSYRIEHADGSVTYVPFNRLDPMGMVFGIAADLHDFSVMDPENRNYTDLATAFSMAIAKNFGERTFLLNLNNMMDALSDPENNMERFLGQTGAAFVPGSSAMRNYANQDPYMREARNILDMALKDLPGYSEGLPMRRDVFGEPVIRQLGLTSNSKTDVVEAEHNRMMLEFGYGLSKPNPSDYGPDLRDVFLKDGTTTAYERLQELSAKPDEKAPTLKESLAKLISSKDYQNMADGPAGVAGTRLNALQGVVQKYRAAAMKRLKAENPEVLGKLEARKLKAAGAFLANSGRDTSRIDQLKDALGISKE